MPLPEFDLLVEALSQCMATAEHLIAVYGNDGEWVTLLLKFGAQERKFRVTNSELRQAMKDAQELPPGT